MNNLGVLNNEYRYMMRQVFAQYIDSREWKEVVKAVKFRDNNACRDCGQTEGKLIVHHTDYDNWGYGDQREINDCVLVCIKCHNKRHRNYSVDVPFWANRRDEIPPELYFDNAREEMRRLHPMNKLRKRKLI